MAYICVEQKAKEMTSEKRTQITESVKRATTYWIKAQISSGKSNEEIQSLYNTEEVRNHIIQSSRNLYS